jgi:hypothetical protein
MRLTSIRALVATAAGSAILVVLGLATIVGLIVGWLL